MCFAILTAWCSNPVKSTKIALMPCHSGPTPFTTPFTAFILVDAAFVSIATVRVENVNLAKRLVCVDDPAVIVLCIHDLLREGVILLYCACLAK